MTTDNLNLLIGAGQLLLSFLVFWNIDKAYLVKKIPNVRIRATIIYILIAGGFAFSGYGAYLANRRPKEIIVDKPVDRTVEKVVQARSARSPPRPQN